MTKFQFGDDDKQMPDPQPVPAGCYPMRLVGCEKRETDSGNELWECKLEILEGEHEGRPVYDAVFFTKKAAPRAWMVLSTFAADNDGSSPEDRASKADTLLEDFDTDSTDLLIGRRAFVNVVHESYTAKNGDARTKAVPDYRGYNPWADGPPEEGEKTEANYEEIPF